MQPIFTPVRLLFLCSLQIFHPLYSQSTSAKSAASFARLITSGIESEGVGLAIGPEEEIVVVGSESMLAGNRALKTVAMSGSGEPHWDRQIALGDYLSGQAVVPAPDGGYVIVGNTKGAAAHDYDLRVIRIDASGNQQWALNLGGSDWDWGSSVAPMGSGYIISGWTHSFGDPNGQGWLIRLSGSGTVQWHTTFGGFDGDQFNKAIATRDGGIAAIGSSNSYSISFDDLWLVRADSMGQRLWYRVFGSTGFDVGNDIIEDVSGDLIIIGATTSVGAGGSDIWVLRLDSEGGMLWSKTFGGPEWDHGSAIIQTPDGGFALVGSTMSRGAGLSDIWLIHIDADGNELWSRTFGGADLDFGNAIQVTSDGGIVLTGQTHSFDAGQGGILVIRTDAAGQVDLSNLQK